MMPATPDLPVVETQIIQMTNDFRANNALKPVSRNIRLDRAALDYARLLAVQNKFAHDADGRAPEDRALEAGYTYCQIAENLALHLNSRGFKSETLAELAIDGWINSPGHRRNLLAPHVTEIGIAVVRAPDRHPKYISVQLLGRPESEAYSFQVSNASKANVTYALAGDTHTIKPGFAIRHTECQPNTLQFTKAQQDGKLRTLKATFKAAGGQVYVVNGSAASQIRVSVEQKRTLSRAKTSRDLTSSSRLGSTSAARPNNASIPLPERAPRR